MWRDGASGIHVAVAGVGVASFDSHCRGTTPGSGPRMPDSSMRLLQADAAAPTGGRILSDPSVVPANYVAQHPNPGEPLGFSESRFTPGTAVDPELNSGVLVDDPIIEEFYDDMDPDAPAPTVSSGEWIRNGRWYTQQSVVYMIRNVSDEKRDSPGDRLELVDSAAGFLPSGYRSRNGIPAGHSLDDWTLSGTRSAQPRPRVEFTFLGLTHWQDAASLTARFPGNIVSNIDPTRGQTGLPAFNASNFQAYSATSKFNSYEMNYRINSRLASRSGGLHARQQLGAAARRAHRCRRYLPACA